MLTSAFWVKLWLTDLLPPVPELGLRAHLKAILTWGDVPSLLAPNSFFLQYMQALCSCSFIPDRSTWHRWDRHGVWGLHTAGFWVCLCSSYWVTENRKNTGRASPPCEAPGAPAASSCSGRSADCPSTSNSSECHAPRVSPYGSDICYIWDTWKDFHQCVSCRGLVDNICWETYLEGKGSECPFTYCF